MLKDLNYICFDLETTWLDLKKDEPIQIGLLSFDKNFDIKIEYKSYICPENWKQDIKDIVKFITWIEYKDLENSPNIQKIIDKISQYFTPNTVVIWHNIQFDINMLSKYMDISNIKYVDTFHLSKAIFNFLPSYSLEVILEILKKDYNIDLGDNYHDALTDSYACYYIFKIFTERLEYLLQKYPTITNSILKSNSIYSYIYHIKSYSNNVKSSFLPWLKKEVKWSSKLISNSENFIESLNDKDRVYIWDMKLKEVLFNIVSSWQKSLIVFSSNWKLKIAKNILSEIWVKDIGYLSDSFIFDWDKVALFLQKSNFEEYEINFLIKYFNQYDKWHSFLDLSLAEDFKIMKFLQKSIDKRLPNIVVWQHSWLFSLIKEKDYISDYSIYFFDWDSWYNSFSRYLNKPFDLYNLIYHLEFLLYKYSIHNYDIDKLYSFYNFIMILSWVLYQELTKQFVWVSKDILEIDPIVWNIDFYKTNKLLDYLDIRLLQLKKFMEYDDYIELKSQVDDLFWILNTICLVKKNMFQEDKFYYVFFRTDNVINYQEFMDYFDENRTYFLSNYSKDGIKPKWESSFERSIKIVKNNNIDSIDKLLSNYDSIFVLSTNKQKSKELFEYLIWNWYEKDFKILVENITWWVWKNLFYSKSSWKKIVIWWFEFLLNLFAEKIKFDIINIYFANWPFEKQIISDIYYYWSN